MANVFNFSAGPAMMPKAILEQAQQELLNWQGQGTSVMEVSHRGKLFMELVSQSQADFRKLYNIPENYHVLFLQGGARGQFAAIPMNLLRENGKALYLNSGHWSATAAKEARSFGEIDEINILEPGDELKVKSLDFSDIAEQYDVIFCATSFASLFKNAAAKGTVVIGMRNILSLEEIRLRLQNAGLAPNTTGMD